MRPNFGCDIHNLVFAPNNATTWGLAAHYTEEALGWWEPRIDVTEIDPQPDPEDASRLLINIKYVLKATNDARNLVYPFYLLPGRA
jgi:phage baseplate assembly protein W